MFTCAACNTTDHLRGVNLSRGCFTICRTCRAEWEAQALGTPDDRALSFDVADLRDSVLYVVREQINAEHERRDAATRERLTRLLDLLTRQGIDPSDAAAMQQVEDLLRAGGER